VLPGTKPNSIILDCDPGQDDAVAILLALASPEELEVLGITTVAGNVPLEKTQRNARLMCDLAGRKAVPVYAGCPRPMVRNLVTAEYVHGREGIDGAEIPMRTLWSGSPFVALSRGVGDRCNLYASYSSAFRAPSLRARSRNSCR